MPNYNVMINRTRTIEQSVEIEVSAKNEEVAQEKAEELVSAASAKGEIDKAFEWEETSTDDEYDYEVSE